VALARPSLSPSDIPRLVPEPRTETGCGWRSGPDQTAELGYEQQRLSDLTLERVDHAKRDRDAFAGIVGEIRAVEKRAAVRAGDLPERAGADAVVIEQVDRPDPQQPLGALVDQRLSQMQPRAPLADVLRSDPRFGQPTLGEQFAQP
jgi:hypothetical protein